MNCFRRLACPGTNSVDNGSCLSDAGPCKQGQRQGTTEQLQVEVVARSMPGFHQPGLVGILERGAQVPQRVVPFAPAPCSSGLHAGLARATGPFV